MFSSKGKKMHSQNLLSNNNKNGDMNSLSDTCNIITNVQKVRNPSKEGLFSLEGSVFKNGTYSSNVEIHIPDPTAPMKHNKTRITTHQITSRFIWRSSLERLYLEW